MNTDTLDRAAATTKPIPFDAAKLDALMDDAGIDLLLVTSKHNVQYLLGGYRFFFFDYMDALGDEPLSADRAVSARRPAGRGLFRLWAGDVRARARQVLDPHM